LETTAKVKRKAHESNDDRLCQLLKTKAESVNPPLVLRGRVVLILSVLVTSLYNFCAMELIYSRGCQLSGVIRRAHGVNPTLYAFFSFFMILAPPQVKNRIFV